ncbi:MAG: serine/threonine protein kinase [Kiritimatiellae bacterium]|nr:serine/threonine protein kinase [Kiritimatiellia bacterium]
MPEETQTVCGSWRLVREIGRGAYGTVFLAEGPKGEHAAVKVCRRETTDPERYARELRGATLYRFIPPSEGLLRMREIGEEPWGFYAVMDLADDEFGGRAASPAYRPKTLADVIRGEKALPLGECVALGIALARGLVVLQRHHLLHRDIKPGNVVFVGGRPVLSDPGLLVEEAESSSLVGTPGYVPPERFVGAAGDVYSLGLTLKAASFGRAVEDLDKGPAHEADTGSALFPAWWRILNKATDPTPSRRYRSAKAFVKDLQLLRVRMTLPPMRVVASVAAAVALAVAIYFALSVKVWIDRREADEKASIEETKRALETTVKEAGKELDDLLGDLEKAQP